LQSLAEPTGSPAFCASQAAKLSRQFSATFNRRSNKLPPEGPAQEDSMRNDLARLILNHRSIRGYTDEPIPDEIVGDILDAAQMAPTSNFLQAYSIIVVREPEAKLTISNLCRGQLWIQRCPIFLVFCMDYYRLMLACRRHGVEMNVNEVENLLVGAVDVALAAQNAATVAESYGLGCVMVGGVRNRPDEIAAFLKLPEYAVPMIGLSIGYPDESPQQKPRLPRKAVVHDEVYSGDAVLLSAMEEYDAIVEDYYDRRTEGDKRESWSQKISVFFQKKSRPQMRDFLIEKGFRFY
jgi:nitroreductase